MKCPTCQQKQTEIAPGVWEWAPSTYLLKGVKHDCDCRWQDDLRRHYLLAGIPIDYWTLSREHWVSSDTAALDSAEIYLKDWASFKRQGVGISFLSKRQGTGKTMLSCLIAKELIKRKVAIQFIHFREMVGVFEAPYEKRETQERHLRNVPLLILDEVTQGWSDQSDHLFSNQLEDLIRFRTGGHAVTIITSNLTNQELDDAYPRTFSLLNRKQIPIHVDGTDFRRDGEWYTPEEEVRPIV